MIHLTSETEILLALKPVDFRKRIDGLSAICRNQFSENPNSGKLFVFVNRSKTMVAILSYESNGFWLQTKRLSRGKFNWPKSGSEISMVEASYLRRMLSGLCK